MIVVTIYKIDMVPMEQLDIEQLFITLYGTHRWSTRHTLGMEPCFPFMPIPLFERHFQKPPRYRTEPVEQEEEKVHATIDQFPNLALVTFNVTHRYYLKIQCSYRMFLSFLGFFLLFSFEIL